MSFGENLREHRIAVGLTQAQLAEKLGVKQSCIAMWENGDRNPNMIALKKLAIVLDCTIDELLAPIKI